MAEQLTRNEQVSSSNLLVGSMFVLVFILVHLLMFVSFSEYGASTVSPGSLNQDLGGDSLNILQVECQCHTR